MLGKFSDHRFQFGQQNVLFEGVLGGDGLCWSVRDYLAVVDSPGQLVEAQAIAAEDVDLLGGWATAKQAAVPLYGTGGRGGE